MIIIIRIIIIIISIIKQNKNKILERDWLLAARFKHEEDKICALLVTGQCIMAVDASSCAIGQYEFFACAVVAYSQSKQLFSCERGLINW